VPGQGRVRADDGLLTVGNADELDTGNYTCSASNLAGTTSHNVWIVVSGMALLTVTSRRHFHRYCCRSLGDIPAPNKCAEERRPENVTNTALCNGARCNSTLHSFLGDN